MRLLWKTLPDDLKVTVFTFLAEMHAQGPVHAVCGQFRLIFRFNSRYGRQYPEDVLGEELYQKIHDRVYYDYFVGCELPVVMKLGHYYPDEIMRRVSTKTVETGLFATAHFMYNTRQNADFQVFLKRDSPRKVKIHRCVAYSAKVLYALRWYNFPLKLELTDYYLYKCTRLRYEHQSGFAEVIDAGVETGIYTYPSEAQFSSQRLQFVSKHTVKFAARTTNTYWTGRTKKEGRRWFFEYAHLDNEDELLWESYKESTSRGGVVNTRLYIDERLPLVRHPGRGNAVDIHTLLRTKL